MGGRDRPHDLPGDHLSSAKVEEQSRKAKEAAGRFALIHSLDSAKLARKLAAHSAAIERPTDAIERLTVLTERLVALRERFARPWRSEQAEVQRRRLLHYFVQYLPTALVDGSWLQGGVRVMTEPRFGLPRERRVQSRRDFLRAQEGGVRVTTAHFVFLLAKSPGEPAAGYQPGPGSAHRWPARQLPPGHPPARRPSPCRCRCRNRRSRWRSRPTRRRRRSA